MSLTNPRLAAAPAARYILTSYILNWQVALGSDHACLAGTDVPANGL